MSVSGDATRAPTCAIHGSTPWPTPGMSRPGKRRSTVAISIAVSATLRSGIGATPIPTFSVVVQASAADAAAKADSRKQSSHSQSSGTPESSAACAASRRASGGE